MNEDLQVGLGYVEPYLSWQRILRVAFQSRNLPRTIVANGLCRRKSQRHVERIGKVDEELDRERQYHQVNKYEPGDEKRNAQRNVARNCLALMRIKPGGDK